MTRSNIQISFSHFHIHGVEDGSGVFTGTNYAHGWSSFSKVNNGFGSVSDSKTWNNCCFVYDNDQIDCPIDDRDVFITTERTSEVQHQFDLQSINVNALINNSTIAVGENNQMGWSGHSKRNHGTGNFTGENVASHIYNRLEDNDYIDAPIHDQDYKPSIMNQKL